MTEDSRPHSKWSVYINKKYKDFRKDKIGASATLSAFGRQFGAGHTIVLGWLRDESEPPRSPKYVKRIIEVYGPEAYEPLGIPVPENFNIPGTGPLSSKQIRALELLSEAPEDSQDEILDLVEHYLFKHGFRRSG